MLNRSDRRWASSTNPWWRSIRSDHVIGMEPHRAVRIWVRTGARKRAGCNKAVCRVAVCSLSQHRLDPFAHCEPNAMQLGNEKENVDYFGSPCKGLGTTLGCGKCQRKVLGELLG